MPHKDPIEFSGKVLDQRNDLTGPDDAGKVDHPKRPEHVSINDSKKMK
jgi:hypothetical protein